MRSFFVLNILVTSASAMPVAAESERNWRLSAGIHTSGRGIAQNMRIADGENTSGFSLEPNSVSGVEISVARELWSNWRVLGYYAQMSSEESGQWELVYEGASHRIEIGNEAREQKLGAEVQRLFQWGDNWVPFLGAGLALSRFDGDAYLELTPLEGGATERRRGSLPRENDWSYSGVAGIEYRFRESWSVEFEIQFTGYLDGGASDDSGTGGALRLGYRF